MAIPSITSVSPPQGPTSGGALVRIAGGGYVVGTRVSFGGRPAAVVAVRGTDVDVRTPAHHEGFVTVVVDNGVPGEVAAAPSAYRYIRARLAAEADVTRVVRTLLRSLKEQVLANTSLSVAMDFDDVPGDAVALSKLPSLVLTGPNLRENRVYATNELTEEAVSGELRRRRPSRTMDVELGVTGASDHAVELLNLLASLASYFSRNPWIVMPRDEADPASPLVRWELDSVGEARTNLEGEGDVRAFTWGLAIRGVDIDEGLPFDLGRALPPAGPDVRTGALP